MSRVSDAISRLRSTRDFIAYGNATEIQERAIRALSTLSDDQSINRIIQHASKFDPHFQNIAISLEALLKSWENTELRDLIESEQINRISESEPTKVVGHFIASNTPLLTWTSVARALLVGAGSFVRLPFENKLIRDWSNLFVHVIATIDPQLSELIVLDSWYKDEQVLTVELCQNSDTILAYGSDETIAYLKGQTPDRKCFLGFGSKISIGIYVGDTRPHDLTRSAMDILINDQQGCLSPQCLLIEGDFENALSSTTVLLSELERVAPRFPKRDPRQAALIREFTDSARFEHGAKIFQDGNLRWTVIMSPSSDIQIAGPPGCVFVKPIALENLEKILSQWTGRLQGSSVETKDLVKENEISGLLTKFGVSYVCKPGKLQCPPFSWHEDGHPVVSSLFRTGQL